MVGKTSGRSNLTICIVNPDIALLDFGGQSLEIHELKFSDDIYIA